MMPLALVSNHANSMKTDTIILFGQDDEGEVQHDLFGHIMLLALASASHDTEDIVNSTIAFLTLR